MPTGMVINAVSMLFGGIFGTLAGHKLSVKFKAEITLVFGVCSMGMGVSTIGSMKHIPTVIFALVVGTGVGLALHLGEAFNKGAMLMQKPISKLMKNRRTELSEEEFMETLVTIIVLFCASETGIYGSLSAGMTGDNTILISESILNFLTTAIFACNLGYVVSMIAMPQFIVFFILFLLAEIIFPMMAPNMILDFKAYGGFLMLAAGFRMVKLKEFPTADMMPAMILVMPFSWI